ncbi:hypothetical protein TNCV_4421801 [Trichonephila clavipes]|nr:hypothetical protein TNCV_4421801 [Trichonephila clavipes]
MKTKTWVIVCQTGIGRKIGGRQEVTIDTLTTADRRGNSTGAVVSKTAQYVTQLVPESVIERDTFGERA